MKKDGPCHGDQGRKTKFLYSSIQHKLINHRRRAGADKDVEGGGDLEKQILWHQESGPCRLERTVPAEQEKMPFGQRAKVVKSEVGRRGRSPEKQATKGMRVKTGPQES